jgi:two-component system, NarL family, invasion response regulator UvrY
MTEISILLVDDHPVVREGYRRLLERREGFRVVAEAEDAVSAYRVYRAAKPDIVVMDLTPPGPGGLEAVRDIRQWDRAARILIFTMHASAAFTLKAFEAAVNGYITKSSAPPELVRAIATVAKGGRALSEDIAREVAAERLSGQRSLVEDLGRAKPRSSVWSRRAGPRKRSPRR